MPDKAENIIMEELTFEYTTPEGDNITLDFYTDLLNDDVPLKSLKELPATYGFVGSVCANLLSRARELEDDLENWVAEKDMEARETVAKPRGRPPSETMIRNMIKQDQIWLTKRNNINKAWTAYARAKALLEALAFKYGVNELIVKKDKDINDSDHLYPKLFSSGSIPDKIKNSVVYRKKIKIKKRK